MATTPVVVPPPATALATLPASWLFVAAGGSGLPVLSVRHSIAQPLALAQQGLVLALQSSARASGVRLLRLADARGAALVYAPPHDAALPRDALVAAALIETL